MSTTAPKPTDTATVNRIAALLGSNSDWDDPAAYLETIALMIKQTSRPDPGNQINLGLYRAKADRLGIDHDDEDGAW